jgi:hypothetical protein
MIKKDGSKKPLIQEAFRVLTQRNITINDVPSVFIDRLGEEFVRDAWATAKTKVATMKK